MRASVSQSTESKESASALASFEDFEAKGRFAGFAPKRTTGLSIAATWEQNPKLIQEREKKKPAGESNKATF